MKSKIVIIVLLCCGSIFQLSAKSNIKVACVGNSVTYGYLLMSREVNCYPAQLQKMLGDKYEVRNFGHSGATLLRHGHNPYNKLPECREALKFAADHVIIHLGLNDTDPRDWPDYGDNFIGDYRALIDSFRQANPKCKIWICLLTPIGNRHPRFLSGTRDWHAQIQTKIRQIAATSHVGLIDLNTPLACRPDLFPDALHPNPEGAGIIARTIFQALTGNYGGLSVPDIYADNMVVQREKPLTFTGKANVGEKVTVSFARQEVTTTAQTDGTWKAEFPSMSAGGPYTLDMKAKSGTRTFRNVWVGEVWICSGQSNMEFQLSRCRTAKADDAAADTLSRLHLYNMQARYPTYAIAWKPELLDSVSRLDYFVKRPWTVSNARAARSFSAIAFHFGKMLTDSLPGIHIGLICNAVGGSSTESWIARETLEKDYPEICSDWLHNDHIDEWVRGRAEVNLKQSTNPLQRHPYEPSYLFEAGMQPLTCFSTRGFLWYQGESNANRMEIHNRLFPLLIESWRKAWNDATLPFYFVQLSSLSRPSWPRFRNSQRLLQPSMPNVEMVVSSDKGDSLDVHPTFKKEIGERLALQALFHVYGHKNVEPCGPSLLSVERKGSAVVLSFLYGKGLKAAQRQLVGFEVAGEDGIFYPAKAEIENDKVNAWSEAVAKPCSVRYGWQPFTRANLVNAAGLPASTFQSEVQ